MTNPATSTKKKRRTGSAPPGFERVSTLAKRVGFAESTVKGWAANKALNFPAPIKLGARVSIYAIAAVDAWMSDEERRQRDEKRKWEVEKEAKAAMAKHDRAAVRANEIWDSGRPAPADHPYLWHKRVRSHGLRMGTWRKWCPKARDERVVSDNALLIPLQNAAGEIRSMQAILPSKDNWLGRDKDFPFGAEKNGLFFPIGSPIDRDDTGIVLIGEGYARGSEVTTTEGIAGHIARLQPGRPGISDWAQREVVRLRGKLEAAAVMPKGRWRDLTVKAVESQLSALDAELARLEAPVITPRVVLGGAA